MAKKRKAKSAPARAHNNRGLTPVIQFGVVFVIVFAMILLMYVARMLP